MKVLYIITKSEIGGAQVHIAGLLKEHIKIGDTVAVSAYPGGFLEDFCRQQNISFFLNEYFKNTFNPIILIKSFFKTMRAIKDFNPDIISCHSGIAGIIGRKASFLLRVPAVYTVHSYAFMPGHPFIRRIFAYFAECLLSFFSKTTISVSKFSKDIAEKYCVPRAQEIQVIYNGAPCESMDGINKNPRERHIVFVGRFARPKTPEIIIRALSQILDSMYVPTFFDVVGDGPDRNKLESLAQENGIQKHVIFHGSCMQNEVKSILQKADVFILPSDWEGLPISILEAMSLGIPTIASDVGGIGELITSDTGVLMNKKAQPSDWAHEIISLINNKDKAQKLGLAAHDRICKHFSFEETFLKTRETYKRVLGME